jgi:hypothetical protein
MARHRAVQWRWRGPTRLQPQERRDPVMLATRRMREMLPIPLDLVCGYAMCESGLGWTWVA